MTDLLSQFVNFLATHQLLAILFAFLVAFGEALLILGLFVPSTVVLVGLGTLIGMGKIDFPMIFVATVAGAIAGDALSFWVGVRWKQQLRTLWPFSHYGALLEKGEQFIARHGGKSIFIVRFIPGVKAVVPTIAGMMGMPSTRFAVVNVVSAFVWAAVHLLPAIALGRGLQVAHAANPRFAILAGLGVAAAVLVWAVLRIVQGVMVPALDRGRLQLALWLERQGGGSGALARLLRNHDRMLEAAALLGLALCALAGFALVLSAVMFDPQMALADVAIGQFAQGLRTDWATSVMVGITMLGDVAVLLPVTLLLIGVLASSRQWVLACALAAASLIGAAFVPLFKTLLQRARPMSLFQDADGFSIPSGHSTLATVVFGALALLLAQSVPARFRRLVYASFATLIALIALSRVYLQAHWPSDVLAGVLFGCALVSGLALLLQARGVTISRRMLAALLIVIGLGIMPLHIWTGWSTATARYDAVPPLRTLAIADWLTTGWKDLPARRILLDGDSGEAMLLQSTWPLAKMVATLEAAGWQSSRTTLPGEIVSAVLPSRQTLGNRAPWPMTHLGRAALATLTRTDANDRRRILRIWATQTLVQDGANDAPLYLVSLTADKLDPVAFGYTQLVAATVDTGQLATEKANLLAVFRQTVNTPGQIVDLPLAAMP